MKLSICVGNYKLTLGKKQEADLKFEYSFTEYGNEYYTAYLNGKKIRDAVISWDRQRVAKELSREYELKNITW
jgi:hypothetical protein